MSARLAFGLSALLLAFSGAGAAQPAGGEALPAPVTDADYAPVDPAEAALGRLLFWDPILSGNRNISCGTCHHPKFGTSDGVALSLGEGGIGLGPDRRVDPSDPPEQRVPRNAPALFNLGAREFTRLFHDGRIEADPAKPGGLRTPLDADMTTGFANVLSAQTMFPVLSQDEMAGHYSENDVSAAVRQGRLTGPGGAWDLIARRVAAIPAYAAGFAAAYPGIDAPADIAFTDISNAIAAFVAEEWRSDTSPFDAYLRGTGDLPPRAMQGMELFYGKAGCSACHSGKFQTDQQFHAAGVPQFGPGKAARFETHSRDTGRMRVTGRAADAYAFRTPSLRNVTATAPYGHDGAFATLAGFLRQHLDPLGAPPFDRSRVALPPLPGGTDWAVMDSASDQAALRAAIAMPPVTLAQGEFDALLAFLGALDDPQARAGRRGIPDAVPSGLPVDR
ncbi:cytochrome-c peroxidase [Brevirhabdus sp.]|uniref:cytochrome-c peroxidase n=1 Tax=Brevirhabdus sp. TaxID=2004514 RepID=UPI004058B601